MSDKYNKYKDIYSDKKNEKEKIKNATDSGKKMCKAFGKFGKIVCKVGIKKGEEILNDGISSVEEHDMNANKELDGFMKGTGLSVKYGDEAPTQPTAKTTQTLEKKQDFNKSPKIQSQLIHPLEHNEISKFNAYCKKQDCSYYEQKDFFKYLQQRKTELLNKKQPQKWQQEFDLFLKTQKNWQILGTIEKTKNLNSLEQTLLNNFFRKDKTPETCKLELENILMLEKAKPYSNEKWNKTFSLYSTGKFKNANSNLSYAELCAADEMLTKRGVRVDYRQDIIANLSNQKADIIKNIGRVSWKEKFENFLKYGPGVLATAEHKNQIKQNHTMPKQTTQDTLQNDSGLKM